MWLRDTHKVDDTDVPAMKVKIKINNKIKPTKFISKTNGIIIKTKNNSYRTKLIFTNFINIHYTINSIPTKSNKSLNKILGNVITNTIKTRTFCNTNSNFTSITIPKISYTIVTYSKISNSIRNKLYK